MKLKILFYFLLTVLCSAISAQVKIRLFANQSPESAVFSVTNGSYEINLFNGHLLNVTKDEPVVIMKFNGKLAVKKRNGDGVICDSLNFKGTTGKDFFSLRMNNKSHSKQLYSGDLQCFPDLGTLVFINLEDIEKYVAGVVMAEGGAGKNLEYFKTQAIIARTYMYKYINKHISDGYNVCDNTDCQAFNGLSGDTLLNEAAMETRGLVLLDNDSSLIMAAFHSNCGGETSTSEDVWLSGKSYLKNINDPYCLTSKNATWQKSFSGVDWVNYLRKSGYIEKGDDLAIFNFQQDSRVPDYKTGNFKIPLRIMRTDLNLRSTFFSVYAKGDSIILKGRGYGHGVGLCQEGAMMMALKGFNYQKIIDFYYPGVTISNVKNAIALH